MLRSQQPVQIPGFVRLLFSHPILRDLPSRIIGLGVKRVHVQAE